MTHCTRHYEEPALDVCKHCGGTFCSRCLVYPFGNHKPPYCVGCAIAASGVRSRGKIAVQAPKPERMTRAQRAQARADKKALKKAERHHKPILEEAQLQPADPTVVAVAGRRFGWNRTDAAPPTTATQDTDGWPAGPLVS